MCFRAEAETLKKGYNHATLNFFFWSTCFVKKYKKIRFIKRPIKAPYKKNGKSWKNVPKTGFEKDIYEHATQENVKKNEKGCFVQSLKKRNTQRSPGRPQEPEIASKIGAGCAVAITTRHKKIRKENIKMLLWEKHVDTPHTREPEATPATGNCIQKWDRSRRVVLDCYTHATCPQICIFVKVSAGMTYAQM